MENSTQEDMEFKKYKERRKEALEAFREFIKTLPGKGFTVQQIKIIGMNAQREVESIVADIEKELVLTPNLTDLLK